MSKFLPLRLHLCIRFWKAKAWPLTGHWLSCSGFLLVVTKPCSVEVLGNVWLHIRGLLFVSKEARNAISSCLLGRLNSQSCATEKSREVVLLTDCCFLVFSDKDLTCDLCTTWTAKSVSRTHLANWDQEVTNRFVCVCVCFLFPPPLSKTQGGC